MENKNPKGLKIVMKRSYSGYRSHIFTWMTQLHQEFCFVTFFFTKKSKHGCSLKYFTHQVLIKFK